MVLRLSELDPAEAKHLGAIKCPTFAGRPFVPRKPLDRRRIAKNTRATAPLTASINDCGSGTTTRPTTPLKFCGLLICVAVETKSREKFPSVGSGS